MDAYRPNADANADATNSLFNYPSNDRRHIEYQTIGSISHFILAMVQNPDVLARMQAEIDNVVGANMLPTFKDRPKLPYGDHDCCFICRPFIS